jgi:hypothetical protein
MDRYHLTLYLHIFALLAAASASGIVHFAEGRFARATSVVDAKQWHALIGSTARTFPIAVLVLLATGGFMVADGGIWPWGAGWVEAGLVGSFLLLLFGGFLGTRSARIGRQLEAMPAARLGPTVSLPHDPLVHTLSWVNTGLALAVVFDMVTKPTLLPSLSVLAVGALAGLAVAARGERRTVVVENVTATSGGE